MSMRKFHPRGEPDSDAQRLSSWWQAELEGCGVRGEVPVSHTPYEDPPDSRGWGKALFDVLAGSDQLQAVHAYHAKLPGTPFPIEATVLTTGKGEIASVIYHAELSKNVDAEFRFVSKPGRIAGVIGHYARFEGEGTDALNANKDLCKKMGAAVAHYYRRKGVMFSVSQATYHLEPGEGGALVTVLTLPQISSVAADLLTLGRSRLTLGLGKLMGALQVLEASL